MNSLPLSLSEIAVLNAAKKSSSKSQIVARALAMVPGDTGQINRSIDRLHLAKLLTRTDAAQYELTEKGYRDVGEALKGLETFIQNLRYGAQS